MKKIISFFFCISTISCVAQVSGYMGKRFSVGYSNYFSPRLPILPEIMKGLDSYTYIKMGSNRKFNYTHAVDLDYIIGSKTSLCVSGQFSTMDFCSYGSTFDIKESENGIPSSYSINYFPKGGKCMELKTTNFSIGFKFFRSKYMNPFGKYRKIEFILVTDKVKMDKDEFYYEEKQYFPYKYNYVVPDKPYRYKSFVFAYTIGKQRVLFNKVILDYGLRIGLNCYYILKQSAIGEAISTIKEKDNEERTLETGLKNAADMRIFQSQLLNAHIGFRFLAF